MKNAMTANRVAALRRAAENGSVTKEDLIRMGMDKRGASRAWNWLRWKHPDHLIDKDGNITDAGREKLLDYDKNGPKGAPPTHMQRAKAKNRRARNAVAKILDKFIPPK